MLKDRIEKLRDFLLSRKQAYLKIFSGEPGRKVLKDLAKFCRANQSTFHEDPRIAAMLDGRREVWLRIQQQLQLTPEELFQLYDVED